MDLDILRIVSPPSRIFNTSEIVLEVDKWLEGSSEPESSPERGICVLFRAIVNSQTGRRRATRHYPLHPPETAIVDSRSTDEIVGELVPFLVKVQRMFAEQEPNSLGSYVDRRILYIHYAMDFSVCNEVSQRLFARYEAKGDRVGMANCKLLQADAMLSSPFTAPIVLNQIPLILPGATGTSEVLWDEVEAQCPLKPCEEAAQLYEEVLEFYRQASASRGQAAIWLRKITRWSRLTGLVPICGLHPP